MTQLYVGRFKTASVLCLALVALSSMAACSKKKGINIAGVDGANSAAVVTSISPAKGFSGGATEITINGTGFVNGATVTVGGNPCTPVVFVSATQLKCTTSAHPDTANADVVVTNPGAEAATLPAAYTYQTAPDISSISPSGGALAGGTTLTITGNALSPSATVTIGGQPCANPVVNETQTELTCTVPGPGVGDAAVVINNPGAAPVSGPDFTYAPAPVVTSVSPALGPIAGGTLLTITGTDFVNGATVRVGGSACAATFVSATQLTCTTPAHAAGTVSVQVINPDTQNYSLAGSFAFLVPPNPISVEPPGGSTMGGTAITISGTGFNNPAVTVGGSACAIGFSSATSITCTTTAHAAGTVDLVVTNTGELSGTLAGQFTFAAPPVLTSIDKSSGGTIGGATLTLTGSEFSDSATVTLKAAADPSGYTCSITSRSSTQIVCTTPAHAAGIVSVKVTNPDAQFSTLADSYTYRSFGLIAQNTTVPALAVNPSSGALANPNNPAVAALGTKAVAVHPSKPYAYTVSGVPLAAACGDDCIQLGQYAVDPDTGALTQVGGTTDSIDLYPNPGNIVIHPSGKWLYVPIRGTNVSNSLIHKFTIDPIDGHLTDAGTFLSDTGVGAIWMTVTPDGKFAYVVYEANSLLARFSIDSETGDLTHNLTSNYSGTVASNPRALAVDPTGKFLYVAHFGSNYVSGFNINPFNGALSSHAGTYALGGASQSTAITVDPSGKFLYVANDSNQITKFNVDLIDGTLSGVTNYPITEAASHPFQVQTDPAGKNLYVVANFTGAGTTGKIIGYAINSANGALSGENDALINLRGPKGIAFTKY